MQMKESKLAAVRKKYNIVESKDGFSSPRSGSILLIPSVFFVVGTAGAISIYEEGSP